MFPGSLLGSEMRIYMMEMMQFQNEIRRLKAEIEELKAWKERELAGIPVEWLPPSLQPALPPPPPPEPVPPPQEDYEPARGAWRSVQKRSAKLKKPKIGQQRLIEAGPASPPPASPPPPPQASMPGGFAMSSWAQWRPNPVYSPAPVRAPQPFPLSGRGGPLGAAFGGGLFGPPSPGPG
ncbi:hypothetical protein L218DRAFT_1009138 [Marasmius fiardii PR-910]|nr:hypothetical protein L218DRAFT_1009138 [Marasmius fiardii PR-910]